MQTANIAKPIEKLTPVAERLAEQEKLLFSLHDYITRLEHRLDTVMDPTPAAQSKSDPERPHEHMLTVALEKRNSGIVEANSRIENILARLQI